MSELRFKNRLSMEKSPYLLQHAENPVDWYPWGEAAFEKAKRYNKPVFLSVGYSTCHWCHVMAHESFEDKEIADILNIHFVPIKVDREERPDVDSVYMSVCQAMTGSGGWPLTIIMTPEQQPFFAGTYLPKSSKYGRMGLIELLREFKRLWETDREKINSIGRDIVNTINSQKEVTSKNYKTHLEIIRRGYMQLLGSFDPVWGGFGDAPKFPTPHNILFLLLYAKAEKEPKAMEMAEKTLERMYRGGIFDHIGGGFSRYSTDKRWLVPHFEKMLYDNSLLTYVYTEAYSMSRRPLYKYAAEKTIEYVLRELTNPQGAFLCAQDADSDGVEGKYYVLTQEEIYAQLGSEEGKIFCGYYGINDKPNFEHGSIPNLIDNQGFEKSMAKFEKHALRLREYREKRTSLHKDDKVLTSWNALMIAALSKASIIFDNPKYFEAAKKAEVFITENLVDVKGRLMVRWREGEAAVPGHIDDYSFYIFALLEMYRGSFQAAYLEKARHYARLMTELFFDTEEGGFYFAAADAEKLIIRPKELYDGAIPSGNSVAALCLSRLARLLGDSELQKTADKQLQYIASEISAYPSAHCFSLMALMSEEYPAAELICVSSGMHTPTELIHLLEHEPCFNLNLVLKNKANSETLKKIAPYSDSYDVPESGTRYYLCKGQSCAPPENDANKISAMLVDII